MLASLPFFSDEASVGLWTFSRAAKGNDWKAVVPLGRLDRKVGAGTARDTIASSVPRIVADGDTALYDTTLAAVDAVRASWQPGPNTVVLISDGKNEDPGSPDLQDHPRPARRRRRPGSPRRGRHDRAGLGCRR